MRRRATSRWRSKRSRGCVAVRSSASWSSKGRARSPTVRLAVCVKRYRSMCRSRRRCGVRAHSGRWLAWAQRRPAYSSCSRRRHCSPMDCEPCSAPLTRGSARCSIARVSRARRTSCCEAPHCECTCARLAAASSISTFARRATPGARTRWPSTREQAWRRGRWRRSVATCGSSCPTAARQATAWLFTPPIGLLWAPSRSTCDIRAISADQTSRCRLANPFICHAAVCCPSPAALPSR